jgi:energy-coupling factor transport system permease protein
MGQYIPLDAPVHRWDSRSKIVAVTGLSVSMIIAPDWPHVAMVSVVILVLIALSKINLRTYLVNLRILLILVFITAFLQLLLVPGQAVFTAWLISVTREGLIAASLLFVRLTGILLLAAWLTFTTRPAQLTAGLERIFSPLARLRLPVHELVMIMTLSLRFLPLLVEETQRIQRAQLARGAAWHHGTLRQKGHYLIALLVPMLRLSLQRAEDLAEAMENRGYHGGQGQTPLYSQGLHPGDWLLIALTMVILVFQLI